MLITNMINRTSFNRGQLQYYSLSSYKKTTISTPIKTSFKKATPQTQQKRTRGLTTIVKNQYSNQPNVAERVIASLPYLLPLLDGLRYGRFFFVEYPVFNKLLQPLQPLIEFYYGFPLGSLIVFFGIYLAIVNNMNLDRFVRLNAMQAILLDIILIVPQLLENVLKLRPTTGLQVSAYMTVYNTIWLFVFICVAYGMGACLVGFTARIPLVNSAAEQQTRF
eukprot:TRINITY_DN4238_c0_g1_i2.p1 TRINITY_DN4238_c0_g1~~TRINITY_DN4238_c0_g1_i2.p1  ORF type:complete len:233 (-),score=19.83 TRINITY_DN4238_c0_g1_i2:143-805(-)